MQPMPAKNRTAVAVGAALLAVAVGGFALWSANRNHQPAPQDQTVVEENTTTDQSTMTPAPTGSETDLTAPLTGSTSTEATTAVAGPPKAAASIPSEYVVKSGDTLASIAAHFYGDATYYSFIGNANPQLEDQNAILPDTHLTLPSMESIQAEMKAVAAPAPAQAQTTAPATTSTTPTNTTPAPGDALAH